MLLFFIFHHSTARFIICHFAVYAYIGRRQGIMKRAVYATCILYIYIWVSILLKRCLRSLSMQRFILMISPLTKFKQPH